jgi:multidrug resistance efflux pump
MTFQPDSSTFTRGRPATRGDASGPLALLQFEGELRRWKTVPELFYFVANEARRVLPYGQMFVLRRSRIGGGLQVAVASSLAAVDRNAPLIRALEAAVAGADGGSTFELRDDAQDELSDYPFRWCRWQPFPGEGDASFGGLLFTGDRPFSDGEALRAERLAEATAHAWRALAGPEPVKIIRKIDRRTRRALYVAAAAIALFPVRLSSLAPVEVVPARPFVVSAPFSGVVQAIEVAPSTPVRAGQRLLRFEDVKLRNELALTTERLSVAKARVERASSAAFGKSDAAHDVAILQAEYDLARAEHDYARDLLSKAHVSAPRDGTAIYTDRREWEGRAVNVGEAIMQIADPAAVAFRIDLPAREQIALAIGAPVKVWLDAQPLWSLDAVLDTASYQARQTPEGVLAFSLTAKPLGARPRIGSRGTARVYGGWAPLAYSVLKRPIGAARQAIGW